MGNRRQRRVKTILPVRLGGTDVIGNRFVAMAHTIDISASGTRLGGVVAELEVGSTVELQCRHLKGRFEVTWVAGSGNDHQVGLKSLEPTKDLWGASLDAHDFEDTYQAPKKSAVTPTRKAPRYAAQASVDMVLLPEHRTISAELQNISQGGCYLKCFTPVDVGRKAELLILVDTLRVNAFGMVRSSHPGKGMGLEFTSFRSAEDELALHAKLAELAGSDAPPKPKREQSEVSKRLQQVTKELYDVEDTIKAAKIDPEVLREFREAVGQVRSTTWALQKSLELDEADEGSDDVRAFLNTERIRLATRLCRHLISDLKKREVDRQSPHLVDLLDAVEVLFTRLAGFEFSVADLGVRKHRSGR